MATMEAGRVAYFEGGYVPIDDAKVSIMTHAFNYGTGLFEGIRGYHVPDEDNVLIFRLREHVERMVRNCNVLCMDIPETRDDLCRICTELVAKSEFKEGVYIRPVVYKSDLSLTPVLHSTESKFCCYVIKLGNYVDVDAGLDVVVSSWRRLSDNAIPSRAKSTGSYLNSSLACTEAHQGGFHEAIVLRENGTVAEGSAMNLFIVNDGVVSTPSAESDILMGITRATVLELVGKEMGRKVVERPIARTELYTCDELFFVGTGAQVAPIRSVDRRPVADGQVGPVTKVVLLLYFDVVGGMVES